MEGEGFYLELGGRILEGSRLTKREGEEMNQAGRDAGTGEEAE